MNLENLKEKLTILKNQLQKLNGFELKLFRLWFEKKYNSSQFDAAKITEEQVESSIRVVDKLLGENQ